MRTSEHFSSIIVGKKDRERERERERGRDEENKNASPLGIFISKEHFHYVCMYVDAT